MQEMTKLRKKIQFLFLKLTFQIKNLEEVLPSH
jgi:hypothetical protein